MTDLQKEKLESIEVNLDEVLERFINNEALYFKCLGKFVDDLNYQKMCDAIENSSVTDAFEHAHALKGVCGNLGFSRLYKEVSTITEVFRAGSMEYDSDNLERLKTEYKNTYDLILNL